MHKPSHPALPSAFRHHRPIITQLIVLLVVVVSAWLLRHHALPMGALLLLLVGGLVFSDAISLRLAALRPGQPSRPVVRDGGLFPAGESRDRDGGR